MKKGLILFSLIIFTLIYSVNVNAANLLFNTSFEDAALTQMTATEICMNLQYSNVGIITSGSGELWVEDGSRMPAGALPHSGTKCIGGRTMAVASGSPRAEYELTHLNGKNPWCASKALNLSVFSDVYVSVWIYLPADYGFSKATYQEIINPFVFSDAEYSPRTSFHIHQKADGTFDLWLEYDYRKAGSGGLSYKIWWVLADPFDISTIRGKWTKWSYFLHRSNNSNEAYMQAWLNDVPFTATPRDPTNPRFTDLNGIDDHGNSTAGRDDWYEHTGESGTFRFVTAPEYNPSWALYYSKMYHDADNREHLMWADDLEVWNGIPTQESATLSGRLTDKSGSALQATISVGSTNSNTDSNGNYFVSVPKGIYDINYSTQNLWIKLFSFNLSSDQKDLINYITKTSNQTSFQINITKDQLTQVYSYIKPSRVLINGTDAIEVNSSSQLTNNTWYFDSAENILYAKPLGGGGCACTYWTNQGCGISGCANNQSYKTRTCSPAGCAITSQCVYNSSCVPTCSDDTLYSQCSSNKPKYCDNGNLIDKCSICNCSTGYNCLANESCNSTIIADYSITGNSSTNSYSAVEHGGSGRTTSSSNAATVITTVMGWMSSGQTVELVGTFSLSNSLSVTKSNILFDFTKATILIASSVQLGIDVNGASNVTFINGDLSGSGYSAGQFLLHVRPGSGTAIHVQGCHFHDVNMALNILNSGYNEIINCTIYNVKGGIFMANTAPYNTITGNDFYGFGSGGSSHAIYLDGAGAIGTNEVSGNKFHDPVSSGGMVIKCPNNKIHDNQFYNFPTNMAVPISMYSQYPTAHADDNEFYNNTFTNCYYTFWIGGNPDAVNPELRTKIHDNTFTNCTYAIQLNYQSSTAVNYTWIYYNKFVSCTNFCAVLGSTNVANTVIAYNDFSQSPVTNKNFETAYTNTMVYGNIGMADFNVPENKQIPPPP